MISNKILFCKQAFDELKKENTLVDMHIHSAYSHDCITPVKSILRRARDLGIGIAITDHLRAEGSIEACKQKKVMVIPGIEIASKENKEILLYFYSVKDLQEYYEKYIKNKLLLHKIPKTGITKAVKSVKSKMKMNDIIEKADKYKCLKSIAHPHTYLNKSSNIFFARKKRACLLKKIEAVEVLNSTQRRKMNKKSLRWAEKRNKAFTAGSDAHALKEVGSGMVLSKADNVKTFLDSIKKKKNFVFGKEIKGPSLLKNYIKSVNVKRKNGWEKINNL